MDKSSESFKKAKRSHWAWHLLLLAAGMLLLTAFIFDDHFVKRWFTVYNQLSEKRQYYLDFFRAVLLTIASGFIVFWFLRKLIIDDWRSAVLRWRIIQYRVDTSAIIPVIESSFIKRFLWLLLPIWIIGVAISIIPGYEIWALHLTEEKGVFETLTVICYLFSGFIALYLVLLQFRRIAPNSLCRWWLLGFSIGCLFIAGEETNWGELYFNYKAINIIKNVNYQNEVSIHNIPLPLIGGYWANDLSHLIAACGGALLPLLTWCSNFFRRLILASEAPLPPWISQAYFFVATIIPQDNVIDLQRANIPSELREITIAIGFTIYAYCLFQNRKKNYGKKMI